MSNGEEAVIAYLKALSTGVEGNHENFSQDNQ